MLAVVALSYLTNHDYLWGGIRETWLRGWENAQIDDLQFREHVRTIPASSDPQPWPEGPLWGKAVLSEGAQAWHEENKSASFLVIQHDSLVHESYFRGHDATTLTNSFSMVKSIAAMAVGMAVGEGLVDEQAPLATYIPRFAEGMDAGLHCQVAEKVLERLAFVFALLDPHNDHGRADLVVDRIDGVFQGAVFAQLGRLGRGTGQENRRVDGEDRGVRARGGADQADDRRFDGLDRPQAVIDLKGLDAVEEIRAHGCCSLEG